MKKVQNETFIFFLFAFSIGVLLFLNKQEKNYVDEFKITDAMITYESYFLPYLYYTMLDENEKACSNIGSVANAWHTLEGQLKNKVVDPEIREDIYLSKQWLFDAFSAGDDSSHRYVCLDLTRFYLKEIRTKLNLDYYLDYLWEFEASLELVHEPAVDPKFCLLEYCELSTLVNDLNTDWYSFHKAIPEEELLNTLKISKYELQNQIALLQQDLDRFSESMETAMADQIAEAANKLNESYLQLLKTFINTESLESLQASRIDKLVVTELKIIE